MKFSVVIPVFNEKATVATIIERVRVVDLPIEIIVVDDGSTDVGFITQNGRPERR